MAHITYGARPGLKRADTGVRAVARTFGKAAFITGGAKSGGAVVLESAAERLTTQLLHLDPNVRRVSTQPLTVDLVDGVVLYTQEHKKAARARHKALGRVSCFYTPDLLAQPSTGVDRVIEVKSEAYPGEENYQLKLQTAESILWRHGMEFVQVVVPGYWRHPLPSNVPLLYQASMRQDLAPGTEVLAQIDNLAHRGACTLGDYCKGLGMDMNMAPVLISGGALSMDIVEHHIQARTPAAPAYGSLDHLSVLGRLVV